MTTYHLTYNSNAEQWVLKLAGSSNVILTASTKDEGIRKSKTHIESKGGGSLRIHNQDGTFDEERTYVKPDPSRSPG
jgi:hypothetical protein